MPATQIGLYNAALFILKQAKLATLSDDIEARYTLDEVYEDVKAYMLEQGLWDFASRTVAIEASEEIEPEFGFDSAFEKPDDFVALIAISNNDQLYPTLDHYLDEGNYWSASVDPLYIQYVSSGVLYGGALSRWTKTYARAVEYELAFRIAPHVTAMSESEMNNLETKRDAALINAKQKDARGGPVSRPPPGRLVRSRMGLRNRSSYDWRERN